MFIFAHFVLTGEEAQNRFLYNINMKYCRSTVVDPVD